MAVCVTVNAFLPFTIVIPIDAVLPSSAHFSVGVFARLRTSVAAAAEEEEEATVNDVVDATTSFSLFVLFASRRSSSRRSHTARAIRMWPFAALQHYVQTDRSSSFAPS